MNDGPMTNPYAPPAMAAADGPARIEDLPAPSRWVRLAAGLIDIAIGCAAFVPAFLFKGYVLQEPWDESSLTSDVAIFAICALLFILVHGYTLHASGQTVGKLALGIAIATTSGRKPSLFTLIMVRTLLFWLLTYHPWMAPLALIDVLFIYRKDRRCLHDLVARTRVVDARMRFAP